LKKTTKKLLSLVDRTHLGIFHRLLAAISKSFSFIFSKKKFFLLRFPWPYDCYVGNQITSAGRKNSGNPFGAMYE
jgi:hypothetical protein